MAFGLVLSKYGVVHIDFEQIRLSWYLFSGSVRAPTSLENPRNERIGIRAFQKIKNYRKRFTELGEPASQRPSLELPERESDLFTTPIAMAERVLSSSQYRTIKIIHNTTCAIFFTYAEDVSGLHTGF